MSWLYNVIGVIFLSVIFEALLPVNKISKFIKSIFSIFVIYSLIVPILKFANVSNITNNFEVASSVYNDELLKQLNTIKNESYSKLIQNSLIYDDILGVEVEINNNLEKNEYEVLNVYVNTSNLVLTENITNINKYEVITKHVKKFLNISEDKIIFYE